MNIDAIQIYYDLDFKNFVGLMLVRLNHFYQIMARHALLIYTRVWYWAPEGASAIAFKQHNLHAEDKIDNVPDQGDAVSAGKSFLFCGKTPAIKFVAADQVDGQDNDKSQQ